VPAFAVDDRGLGREQLAFQWRKFHDAADIRVRYSGVGRVVAQTTVSTGLLAAVNARRHALEQEVIQQEAVEFLLIRGTFSRRAPGGLSHVLRLLNGNRLRVRRGNVDGVSLPPDRLTDTMVSKLLTSDDLEYLTFLECETLGITKLAAWSLPEFNVAASPKAVRKFHDTFPDLKVYAPGDF